MYYALFGENGFGVYDDKNKLWNATGFLHGQGYMYEFDKLGEAKNVAFLGYNSLQRNNSSCNLFNAKRDGMIKLNWLYFKRTIRNHNKAMKRYGRK